MKILLDTQCWLWWISHPSRLTEAAREIISERDNEVHLSAASSWEIGIKYALGKLQVPEPPEEFVPPRLLRDGILPMPIKHIHALRVGALPLYHRDPFDRILIAQAQIEQCTLLSSDSQFADYDVALIRCG